MNQLVENEVTETVFLYPSALTVFDRKVMVHTILGSCVAVCLFDKVLNTGGINHYMLPFWNGEGLSTPKYGNIAIDKLLNKMLAMGSRKEHLVAKVFGGGEVLETNQSSFSIGLRNVEIAYQILNDHNIPIVAQSTGGKQGRKIIFNTVTGEVVQRYIKS